MGKLLTDASYTKRDKKAEVAKAKAGKAKPGFIDLTPTKPKGK